MNRTDLTETSEPRHTMLNVRFEELGAHDVERLATWLSAQHWPFHGRSKVDAAWVRERDDAGYFRSPETKTFWVYGEPPSPLGIVRVFDLADATPLLDLRIGDTQRGKGAGSAALCWVTELVFRSDAGVRRLGGYTRHDHVAMRRVFEKCGYIQEACHRQAWPVEDGSFADAVGYAVLRSEWRCPEPLRRDASSG